MHPSSFGFSGFLRSSAYRLYISLIQVFFRYMRLTAESEQKSAQSIGRYTSLCCTSSKLCFFKMEVVFLLTTMSALPFCEGLLAGIAVVLFLRVFFFTMMMTSTTTAIMNIARTILIAIDFPENKCFVNAEEKPSSRISFR